MLVDFPKHLAETNFSDLAALQHWANRIAPYYRQPVWLCGSALVESNPKPRDYDIRIEMPDKEFEIRFGDVEAWVIQGATGDWTDVRWKWAQQCTKDTKEAWGYTKLNVDFQIYPASYCDMHFKFKPKARLDHFDSFDKGVTF